MHTVLLNHDDIYNSIEQIFTRPKYAYCAVAFWGEGSDALFNKINSNTATKIICNLSSGGTNPFAIKKLQKKSNFELRHNPNLHAKIYLSDKGCVIGSANASTNGLAFNQLDFNGWIEGCVLITENSSDSIRLWIKNLYENSFDITEADLQKAIDIWERRKLPNFTTCLKENFFTNKDFAIAIYNDNKLSDKTLQIMKQYEANGAYEDWPELKPGSKVIDIYFNSSKKIKGGEVYRIFEKNDFTRTDPDYNNDKISHKSINGKECLVTLCTKVETKYFKIDKNDKALLSKIITEHAEEWFSNGNSGKLLSIEEFERLVHAQINHTS